MLQWLHPASLQAGKDALGSYLLSHIALHELALELHQGGLDVLPGQGGSAHDARAYALHEGSQQPRGLGGCLCVHNLTCTTKNHVFFLIESSFPHRCLVS